jgi:hypothetical protein
MFLNFMKAIAYFYAWTWFIWPFAFIASFVYTIKLMMDKNKGVVKMTILSSISLLIIICGICVFK